MTGEKRTPILSGTTYEVPPPHSGVVSTPNLLPVPFGDVVDLRVQGADNGRIYAHALEPAGPNAHTRGRHELLWLQPDSYYGDVPKEPITHPKLFMFQAGTRHGDARYVTKGHWMAVKLPGAFSMEGAFMPQRAAGFRYEAEEGIESLAAFAHGRPLSISVVFAQEADGLFEPLGELRPASGIEPVESWYGGFPLLDPILPGRNYVSANLREEVPRYVGIELFAE